MGRADWHGVLGDACRSGDNRWAVNAADEIAAIVKRVIGDGPRELQKPLLRDDIYVRTCLADDPIGTKYVTAFESTLQRAVGVRHVVAVSSGTAALHLALMAVGVKPGDEVIVPTLTFAATAFAVCHCGAVPHFVDVLEANLGINSYKLRQYLASMPKEDRDRIKAIVPVHLLGLPCDTKGVMEVATGHGIPVIEDAAEALGTGHAGRAGRAGIFSFNVNKIVTTGGGGAVVTEEGGIAFRVKHLSTNARIVHDYLWDHDAVGYNYRMPNLCAALGVYQLDHLGETLKAKLALTNRYADAFSDSKVASFISDSTANGWVNAIALSHEFRNDRNQVIERLQSEGYGARALFTPLHTLPMFKGCPRQPDLKVAEDLFRRVVCLPSSI